MATTPAPLPPTGTITLSPSTSGDADRPNRRFEAWKRSSRLNDVSFVRPGSRLWAV